MSRKDQENLEEAPHPEPRHHVVDFSKKLWLLFLLHEAMHQDHRECNGRADSRKNQGQHSLFSGFDYLDWFATSLFQANCKTLFWPDQNERSAWLDEDGNIMLSYNTVSKIFDVTHERMLADRLALLASIRHSHVNRRFGFSLVQGSRFQDQIHPPALQKKVENDLFPANQLISRRILYRLVRGFFMIPQCHIPLEEKLAPLRIAEIHRPEKWNCWGQGDDFLRSLGGAPRDVEDRIEWEEQQRRAVAVFRTFCGAPTEPDTMREMGVKEPSCGASFENFRKAVKDYYLTKNNEVNVCTLPPFYSKYEPQNAGNFANFKNTQFESEADGWSQFNAALSGVFFAGTGRLDVYGSFAPPPHDPAIEFTCLDIHASRLHVDSISSRGLTLKESGKLPSGCLNHQSDVSYFVRVTGQDTSALDKLLRGGVHIMNVNGARKPFELTCWIMAPTASIQTAVPPDRTGFNTPPTTPNEVVAGYLRSRLAAAQVDWKPPPEVPILEHAIMRFADDKGRAS